MKAVRFSEFGGPEVLRWEEAPDPEPGESELLIEVRAASVNPFDAKVRSGALEDQFHTDLPQVPGSDAAGVVKAVGEGVEGVSAGDEVLGLATSGSYAELAVIGSFAPKPSGLDWELAAALPLVSETATRALKHLGLESGQTLLILGGAGSVGSTAAQLAAKDGITVIGAVAASDDERMREAGGTPVRYGEGLRDRVREVSPDGVDGVIDTAGKGPMEEVLELVSAPDRVVTLVDYAAAERYGIQLTSGGADAAPEGIGRVAELAGAGQFTLPIWRTYPMANASSAHADLESGEAKGKLVLLNG
jgi:NADPH:quinone reductase-like Zn-dependent oxidoreductase